VKISQKMAVTALVAYGFFRGMSIGFYQAFFSYYMKSIGYSMTSIGGVASIAAIVSFVLLPPTGSFIDSYSSREAITLTGILGVVALGLLGLSPSLKIFALSYTLYMMAFFLGQPARSTYLARAVEKKKLGFYMSVIGVAFSAAAIVGPPLGGYLIKLEGYRKIFLLFSIVWLVGLLAYVFLAPKIPEANRRLPTKTEVIARYKSIFKVPKDLRDITLLVSVDRIGWTLWMPILTAHLYNFGYSKEQIGVIFSIFGLTRTITMMLWGKITDITRPYKVLFISEILGALGTIIIAKPTNIIDAYVALILIGLAIAAWIPSYNKFVAEIVPSERYGEAYTTTNAYRSVVGIPMPYVGGFVYDKIGILPLFSSSSSFIALAGILFLILGKRREERKE